MLGTQENTLVQNITEGFKQPIENEINKLVRYFKTYRFCIAIEFFLCQFDNAFSAETASTWIVHSSLLIFKLVQS